MKKILSLLLVAFFATAMVSCEKEDNGGSGDAGFEEANVNEAVINGTTYQLTTEGVAPASNFYTITAYSKNENGRIFTIEGNFWGTSFNKTFDLTKLDDSMVYDMELDSETITEFELQNTMYVIYGSLGDADGAQGYSPFSSGKCRVTVNDSGVTYSLNGTLKDGTTLKFKAFVAMSDITNY